MNNQNTENEPRVQVPIRLDASMYNKFNRISKSTKIPKATLARDAIARHLNDIQIRGITAVLSDTCEEY
jgi:predicted transcriptional regulator